MIYTIKWYAGTYSGQERIRADDADEAVEICKSHVRKKMTLPMYSDGYKVVEEEDE